MGYRFFADNYKGQRLNFDLVDANKNKVVAKAGDKITPRNIKTLLDNGLKSISVNEEELIGKYLLKILLMKILVKFMLKLVMKLQKIL